MNPKVGRNAFGRVTETEGRKRGSYPPLAGGYALSKKIRRIEL